MPSGKRELRKLISCSCRKDWEARAQYPRLHLWANCGLATPTPFQIRVVTELSVGEICRNVRRHWPGEKHKWKLEASPSDHRAYREQPEDCHYTVLWFTMWCTQGSWWLRWWRVHLQCRRPGFNVWIGKITCRKEWQPTPVFLPREFHGQRSLAGYSPWGHKEFNMTEWLTLPHP